jgi:hypothetical protein
MSSSDIVPFFIPIVVALSAFSTVSICCIRRLNTNYRNLEQRVLRLEQKEINNAHPKPSLDPLPIAQQNLNTYAIYPNYQQPSAPYAIQQPYNPYPPASQSYAI